MLRVGQSIREVCHKLAWNGELNLPMVILAFSTCWYSTLVVAQGNDPLRISQAVEACSLDGVLERCPYSCQAACGSTEFLLANAALCDTAFNSLASSDDPSCPEFGEQVVESLNTCIANRGAIKRVYGKVITRDPERLDTVTKFFSDRPECAASTKGLEAMFGCLSGETGAIQSEYESLGSLGIEKNLDSAALKAIACSVNEDRLIEVDIGAKELTRRASDLGDHLGTVTSCRLEYTEWLDSRGEFCENNEFDNCEALISLFQMELAESLDGAAEQNDAISDVLTDLTDDLNAITSLALASEFCD